MITVIETGGKQYCIEPDQTILVNRLETTVGDVITCTNLLDGASVKLEVVAHCLGDKVTSRKFRNKTRYQRVRGHRQPLTALRLAGAKTDKSTKATPEKVAEEA